MNQTLAKPERRSAGNNSSPRGDQSARRKEISVSTKPNASDNKRYTLWGTERKAKLSQRNRVQLTSQLAIMTRSGVDVASAVEALAKQSREADTKQLLAAIHKDVMSGSRFSAALSEHKHLFGASYIASVTAGEASGKMWVVFDQLARLERSGMKLRHSLRTMAAYPVALLTVSSLVIMALLMFVLPRFAEIFDRYDTPLPLATQMLIQLSTEIQVRFWLWIPLVGGLSGTVWAILGSSAGKRTRDRWLLTMPVIGDVCRCLYIGRVCRLLGLLLESGVPLLDAMELVRGSVKNSYYYDMLSEIITNVLNGSGLGNTFLLSKYVPPSASEMILTAEKTGSLGPASSLIGNYFEEEGEEKLRASLVVLEPAVTIVMGALVAFVVLAVALPMFDLSTAVQN